MKLRPFIYFAASLALALASADGVAALPVVDQAAASVSSIPSVPSPAAPRVAGILLDDAAAELTGKWVTSTKQQPLVGASYLHDDRHTDSERMAKFTPEIPEDDRYEVRLLYVATSNRASNAAVTIHSAEGQQTVFVDQKLECLVQGVPRALGTFLFKAGKQGAVIVSNAHADGFVVVDGVQFVPEAIAQAERATHADAGFPVKSEGKSALPEDRELSERRARMAAAVAVSPLAEKTLPGKTAPPSPEPVRLAKDTSAADVDGKSFDLVVVGGTGCGVMCAVRAAREGLAVLLVQHNRHLGGMMANGLMQWDALYGGPRAPLFTELLRNIEKDAVARFGENSRDHQTLRYTHEHYPIGWAEPHVAEREFNRLVAGEKNVIVLLEHYPVAVARDGALLRSVTLREYSGAKRITVRAAAFADATYEGDLFALAKVPYRVGREARDEYGEPHAGKIFCNIASGQAPGEAVEGRLNIRPYGSHQGSVDPASPFTADGAVQAYNYRFCVTRDPANRIMLTEPPPGYDREEYVHYERKSIASSNGPNRKGHMNSPILPGENHAYPEADWPAREKIIERHKNFALGLIWFLQNDAATPEKKRADFREWGLPRDEFADHGHIPYELYVREARRIVGRHVFTEHDNSLAPGLARTPIFPDSIAITDWYMDSHACTTDSRPGFDYDGKLILTEESRPAQIPYRALLPQGVDNLLVPACLSATHVTWGAVRLEPVWMQTGEAAGLAIALAAREKVAPAHLDAERLVRTLAERRQLVTFFNDVKVDAPEPWIPAVQYFGTKGFFASYDARPAAPLAAAVAHQWVRAFAALLAGRLDATAEAAKLHAVETAEGPATTTGALTELLAAAQVPPALAARIVAALPATPDTPLARGAACEALFAAGIR